MTRPLAIALSLVLPACLFDGRGTDGLPCNVDADCGAQACVQQVCGGPDAAGTDGDTDDDGSGDDESSGSGEPPTQQDLEDPCTPGERQCLGSDAIEFCDDDRKLRRYRCEAVCGQGNPVDGGCMTHPDDGLDYCFCEE